MCKIGLQTSSSECTQTNWVLGCDLEIKFNLLFHTVFLHSPITPERPPKRPRSHQKIQESCIWDVFSFWASPNNFSGSNSVQSRFKSEYSDLNPSTWLQISTLTFKILNSNCTSHYSDTTRMRNHWHWFSIWAELNGSDLTFQLFSAFLRLSTIVGGAPRLCSRPSWRWRRTRWSGRGGGGGGQTVALLSVQRQASRRQRQSGQPRFIGNSFTGLYIQSKKCAHLLHILHNCT